MPDNPAKAPRFPYVAALLCAGCVGAAAWTWMRYSYCWRIGTEDYRGLELGRYVQLEGKVSASSRVFTLAHSGATLPCRFPPRSVPAGGLRGVFKGRVVEYRPPAGRLWYGYAPRGCIQIDIATSRFHGASVAGLIVGAMGVFVFAVALRHWLGERRASGGRATA